VDFNFLLAQARSESSLNPHAQASTSSARGLFQFIDSTWLDVIDKHGAKHGLDAAAASISRDRKGRLSVADPAQRSAILKLRDDPYISGLMAAELVQDNAAKLQQELGRAVKPAELYMAHFLGAGGAASFLSRLEENPDTKAEQVVPAAAPAARSGKRQPQYGKLCSTGGNVCRPPAPATGSRRHKRQPQCTTAAGNWQLPRQSVHSATGLHACGTPHGGSSQDGFRNYRAARPAGAAEPGITGPRRPTLRTDLARVAKPHD
jgi:hypothetical protein